MNESMIIIFGNHEKVDTTKQSFRTTDYARILSSWTHFNFESD